MPAFANEAGGVTLERKVLVALSAEDLAEAFCEMDDDAQAQFFVEVARIIRSWEGVARHLAVAAIGNHLRTCECATADARELVRDLAAATEGE
jgi:hypothetical protein